MTVYSIPELAEKLDKNYRTVLRAVQDCGAFEKAGRIYVVNEENLPKVEKTLKRRARNTPDRKKQPS